MEFSSDNSRLNNSAHQILLTENPLTKASASRMISALTISKNRPKVSMVMGRVNRMRMGFTRKFSRLRTTATMIAVR